MYTKTQWVDNTTPIDKNNLNKIEQGIYDNSLVVDAVTNTLNPTDTETYKTAELTEGQITDVIGVSDILIKGQTLQDGEPTPDSPIDVNVVSGSNVVNTSNKNLLDISNLNTQTRNGVTITKNKDNSITLNGTSASAIAIDVPINEITLKENTTYVFSKNTNIAGAFYALSLRESNTAYIDTTSLDSSAKSLNINLSTKKIAKYFRLYIINGKTFTNHTFYPMLEQGSTATTYEPHQGKELPLDLGSIELCKIGDYQDYFYKSGSKWYLHKEVGKLKINNSTDIRQQEQTGFYRYSYTNSLIKNDTSLANSLILFSSYFKPITFNNRNNQTNETVYAICNGYSGQNAIMFNTITFTSLNDFKTWATTNNVSVYYPLATATDTEITDTTLISQLEAIYNAPLYEETNITQTNNDLPMVLDITACKDNINGIKAFIRK